MNVAKPGGPASPAGEADALGVSPGANPVPTGGARGSFYNVLASNQGAPSPAQQARKPAQPFHVPILDDFGISKLGPPGQAPSTNRPGQELRVPQTSRTLEVSGEKVGTATPRAYSPALEAGASPLGWQKLASETFKAETRIDNLIKQAQAGKAFNASELMALQVEVFRYSQTIEVISRTADKLLSAVKQTLATQV